MEAADVRSKQALEEYRFLVLFLSMSLADIEAAMGTQNFNDFDTRLLFLMSKLYKEFKVNKLPTTFESARHYTTSFMPLILVETWANLVSDYMIKSNPEDKTLKQFRFRIGSENVDCPSVQEDLMTAHLECIDDIDIEDESNALRYQLAVLECCERTWLVFVTDTSLHPNSSFIQSCRIKMLTRLSLCYLEAAFRRSDGDYIDVILKPFFYLKQGLRQVNTMTILEYQRPKLLKHIEKPNLEVCALNTVNRMIMARGGNKLRFKIHEEEKFNKNQSDAIVACLNALDTDHLVSKIQLIQGPPGTGKTSTLVGLVKNIFANFASRPRQPIRLLICAPSNGAVDNVGLKLLEEKDNFETILGRSIQMVRIGYFPKVHEGMRKAHFKTIKEDSKLASNDIVMKADIIFTTLGSCHHDLLQVFRSTSGEYASPKYRLSAVIIDEAGQASEPELLLPFIYSVNKFILIGDPQQLPATVISRLASTNNYGRSLFERFFECFRPQFKNVELVQHPPTITLTTQFRMHPDIVAMPSKLFYESKLKTSPGTGEHEKVNVCPYLIFNLANTREQTTSLGHSKKNPIEAVFVRKLLVAILESCGFPMLELITQRREMEEEEKENEDIFYFISRKEPAEKKKLIPLSISVITFYRGQKAELIKEFKNYYDGILMPEIKIDTIDAFQGQEADIVILSTVRTSNSIGFLRSYQRLNVALTRAKSCFYVCMQEEAFQLEENWKELMNDAKMRMIMVETTNENASVKSIRSTIKNYERPQLIVPPEDNSEEYPTLSETSERSSTSIDNAFPTSFAQMAISKKTFPSKEVTKNSKNKKGKWQKLEW